MPIGAKVLLAIPVLCFVLLVLIIIAGTAECAGLDVPGVVCKH